MPVINKDKEDYKKAAKDEVVTGMFYEIYRPDKLPEPVYHATAKKLSKGVKLGFDFKAPDPGLLKELDTNIYMFSAAKTFQQTLEMTEALTDKEGNRLQFTEYKKVATEIYEKYNGDDLDSEEMGGWLKTEYDTAIGQARMADKWNDIQNNKADFPMLMYKTSEGEEVCEICEPLDDIILPCDDPFWDENYPENHFHCNCTVIQMDDETAKEQGGEDSQEDVKAWASASQEKKNPLFNMNAGKDKVIFKDTGRYKHPYFEVPAKYRELAKNNFNLPLP